MDPTTMGFLDPTNKQQRRLNMPNLDLDSLLARAMKAARRKDGLAKLQRHLEEDQIKEEVKKKYGPHSWTPTRLVELIWESPQGETSSLGLFQESVHHGTRATKLEPFLCTPPIDKIIYPKVVRGEHWIHGHISRPRVPDPELREYFTELLEEFG